MKAITFSSYGGPEVLELTEMPVPEPKPNQIRVRVKAVGVTPLDAKLRGGEMQAIMPSKFPSQTGVEFSGVVDALGTEVKNVAVGDAVFGWSDGGATAEYAVSSIFAKKPDGMSFEIAAATPVAAETASRVLKELQVSAGETLLIHGGSGSVGSYAVQLAARNGVRVIASTSAKNFDLVKKLGGTPVEYGPGMVDAVKALTSTVDAVFDAAGKGVLEESIALRGAKDHIVTIADPAAKKLGVHFSTGGKRDAKALERAADQISKQHFVIDIAGTHPLAQTRAAHEAIAGGAGKQVISIS